MRFDTVSAGSASWFAKIDCPLSVGKLPFGNLDRVAVQCRYG